MLKDVRTARQLANLKSQNSELVADGMLHEKSRIMIAGDAGIGKSYAALQMAWESAIGEPWLGTWAVRRPLSVLVIQLEVSEPLFRKRYLRLRHICPDPKNMWFLSDETFEISEDTINDVGTSIATLREGEGNIDLVLLDPLYLMHGGDENSVDEVRPTMHLVDSIRRKYNSAFMIVHHVNKREDYYNQSPRPTMSRIRGSSAWAGWVDTILYLQRESADVLSAYLLKARNRESSIPDQSYQFEWNNGPGKFLHPVGVTAKPLPVREQKRATAAKDFEEAFEACQDRNTATKDDVIKFLIERRWPSTTAYRWLNKLVAEGRFTDERGTLTLVKP